MSKQSKKDSKDQGGPAKRPVPKTKDELIQLLTQKLQTAESAITQMQQTLETEQQKRQAMEEELKEKEDKIAELIQTETKTLQDKVQETLYNTLESVNKIRVEASAKLKTTDAANQTLNEQINALDRNLIDLRLELQAKQKTIFSMDAKKNDLKLKSQNLIKKQQDLQSEKNTLNRELDRVTKQYEQLSGMVENMKKIRLYLNATLEGNGKVPAKGSEQKQNRNKAKAPVNHQDNFWNMDA